MKNYLARNLNFMELEAKSSFFQKIQNLMKSESKLYPKFFKEFISL